MHQRWPRVLSSSTPSGGQPLPGGYECFVAQMLRGSTPSPLLLCAILGPSPSAPRSYSSAWPTWATSTLCTNTRCRESAPRSMLPFLTYTHPITNVNKHPCFGAGGSTSEPSLSSRTPQPARAPTRTPQRGPSPRTPHSPLTSPPPTISRSCGRLASLAS